MEQVSSLLLPSDPFYEPQVVQLVMAEDDVSVVEVRARILEVDDDADGGVGLWTGFGLV